MRVRWLVALALASCASPPLPAELPPLPYDSGFLMRQQLRFTYGDDSGSLEAVVQSRCGVLTIVGLAPFGARVFTLVQRGSALEVKLHLPGIWPFPPENIARDVHRVLLVPLPPEAPASETRELRYAGERVRERWDAGALVERQLLPDAPPGARGVTIVYRDGATREAPAREIRLENRDRGYALELTTLEYRPLACSEAG